MIHEKSDSVIIVLETYVSFVANVIINEERAVPLQNSIYLQSYYRCIRLSFKSVWRVTLLSYEAFNVHNAMISHAQIFICV